LAIKVSRACLGPLLWAIHVDVAVGIPNPFQHAHRKREQVQKQEAADIIAQDFAFDDIW
jgi:hypothetical protein